MSEYTGPGIPDRKSEAGPVSAATESVRGRAGEGATVVAENASEVTATVKDQAAEVAGEAAAQARDLVAEARDQLQEQARSQTRRLAENVRRLADELQEMAHDGKPDSTAAAAMAQLAQGGHRAASHLESRGPDGLVSEVQDFARRRPGLFLAGAAVAGFALGRVGKGVGAAGATGSGRRPAEESSGRLPAAGRPAPAVGRSGSGASAVGARPDPSGRLGQAQPPVTAAAPQAPLAPPGPPTPPTTAADYPGAGTGHLPSATGR